MLACHMPHFVKAPLQRTWQLIPRTEQPGVRNRCYNPCRLKRGEALGVRGLPALLFVSSGRNLWNPHAHVPPISGGWLRSVTVGARTDHSLSPPSKGWV